MPPPFEYQNASLQFEKFLVDARDCAGLATTNMAWNMVVGVLHTFRSRLSTTEVALFCSVLPPVVRALFIEGWDPNIPAKPFGTEAQWLEEVRSVRHEHNFSPTNAVEAVATVLRRNIDARALGQVLARLPAGSESFWRGTPAA